MEEKAQSIIKEIEDLVELVVRTQTTNEQWFLNFLDTLNRISVEF